MQLNERLALVSEEQANIPAIKRFIKKAEKGFRPKSPNDIEHLTYLSACLYITTDIKSAISLLVFLDQNTDTSGDIRQDLAGALADARLLLGLIYSEQGEAQLSKEIMSREDLDASCFFENLENPIVEEITEGRETLEAEEQDEDSKHSDRLRAAYNCYLMTVILTGRLAEFNASAKDKKLLVKTLLENKNKVYDYLVEYPTDKHLREKDSN